MEVLKYILEFLGPVLVAAITIIPSIRSNRKKTDEKIDALSKQLADHIRENEDDNAKQVRTHILRFYDELCEDKVCSESRFEDILDDIDYYEEYVAKHPDFKNNRGEAAMAYIRERYHVEKENGGFLKHK